MLLLPSGVGRQLWLFLGRLINPNLMSGDFRNKGGAAWKGPGSHFPHQPEQCLPLEILLEKKWFLCSNKKKLSLLCPLSSLSPHSTLCPSTLHLPSPGTLVQSELHPPSPGLCWIPGDLPGTSGDGLRIMKASDRPALTGCWEELISRMDIGICSRGEEAPSTSPNIPVPA